MQEVFWINGGAPPHIAIVLRPQGDEWLEESLLRYKDAGIDTLVSLLEPAEAEYYGLREEGAVAAETGLDFLSYPIQDGSIPTDEAGFRRFIEQLALLLQSGARIGVHCLGSIGRSTIVVCSTLMHLGWPAQSTLIAATNARGTVVPETAEQEQWILEYEAHP